MRVLGIETSCDETGVAIYDSEMGLIGHTLYTQAALHAEYGGVVPELASRDHVRILIPLLDKLLSDQTKPASGKKVDGVAYTAGPGLIGALLVGAAIARTLAFAWDVPAVAVHHMEGHLLAPMLEPDPPQFPFVALLVSGGHTQLVKVAGVGQYTLLGETLDDAVGEAFDKTAKLLGLGYPGGAALAALASHGNPKRFHFPRPMMDKPGLEFSFSGLKTYALNCIQQHLIQSDSHLQQEQMKADIACAFQEAVVDVLVSKCKQALYLTGLKTLVVAGGVGANALLRERLHQLTDTHVYFPRLEFCTDNGAMIAYAGCQRLLMGQQQDLAIKVNPRWSLQDISAFNIS